MKPTKWEQKSANHIPAKLISKAQNVLLQFNQKKKQMIKLKMDKEPEWKFFQRRHTNGQ